MKYIFIGLAVVIVTSTLELIRRDMQYELYQIRLAIQEKK